MAASNRSLVQLRQVLAHFAARHRITSVTQFDSLRIWLRLPALTDCKEIRHSASGIATCLNPNGIIWNDVRIMVNIVLLQMVTICLKEGCKLLASGMCRHWRSTWNSGIASRGCWVAAKRSAYWNSGLDESRGRFHLCCSISDWTQPASRPIALSSISSCHSIRP